MSMYRNYDFDTTALSLHYLNHVSAMTGEKLHDKAEIALELAGRDIEIAELRQELAECKAELKSHIALYRAINAFMAELGVEGEICVHTESEITNKIMNRLHDIDDGDFMKYEATHE